MCEYVNTRLDTRVLILTAVDPAFSLGVNVKDMKERKGMFAGTPAELNSWNSIGKISRKSC